MSDSKDWQTYYLKDHNLFYMLVKEAEDEKGFQQQYWLLAVETTWIEGRLWAQPRIGVG